MNFDYKFINFKLSVTHLEVLLCKIMKLYHNVFINVITNNILLEYHMTGLVFRVLIPKNCINILIFKHRQIGKY